jgi:hypothetical protein
VFHILPWNNMQIERLGDGLDADLSLTGEAAMRRSSNSKAGTWRSFSIVADAATRDIRSRDISSLTQFQTHGEAASKYLSREQPAISAALSRKSLWREATRWWVLSGPKRKSRYCPGHLEKVSRRAYLVRFGYSKQNNDLRGPQAGWGQKRP